MQLPKNMTLGTVFGDFVVVSKNILPDKSGLIERTNFEQLVSDFTDPKYLKIKNKSKITKGTIYFKYTDKHNKPEHIRDVDDFIRLNRADVLIFDSEKNTFIDCAIVINGYSYIIRPYCLVYDVAETKEYIADFLPSRSKSEKKQSKLNRFYRQFLDSEKQLFTCIFKAEYEIDNIISEPPKYTDEELFKLFDTPKKKSNKRNNKLVISDAVAEQLTVFPNRLETIDTNSVISDTESVISDTETIDTNSVISYTESVISDTESVISDTESVISDTKTDFIKLSFSRYISSHNDNELIKILLFDLFNSNNNFKNRCNHSKQINILTDIHCDQSGLINSRHFNIKFIPSVLDHHKLSTYHAYIMDDKIVRLTEVFDLLS
jgi:hypothetical protein